MRPWYSLKGSLIVGYKVSIPGRMRYAGYCVYSKLFSVKYSIICIHRRKNPSKQLEVPNKAKVFINVSSKFRDQ